MALFSLTSVVMPITRQTRHLENTFEIPVLSESIE